MCFFFFNFGISINQIYDKCFLQSSKQLTEKPSNEQSFKDTYLSKRGVKEKNSLEQLDHNLKSIDNMPRNCKNMSSHVLEDLKELIRNDPDEGIHFFFQYVSKFLEQLYCVVSVYIYHFSYLVINF